MELHPLETIPAVPGRATLHWLYEESFHFLRVVYCRLSENPSHAFDVSVGALVQVHGSKRRLRMRENCFQNAAVVSLTRVQHVQLRGGAARPRALDEPF